MNKHRYVLLYLFLFVLIGCQNNETIKTTNTEPIEPSISQEAWKKRKVNTDIIETLSKSIQSKNLPESNNQYKLVYHFKGDCSTCIAEILEWTQNSTELKSSKNISLFYVNNSIDNYLLEHYSNVLGIKVLGEIIVDNDSSFYKVNNINFMNWNNTNILLIDSINEVVAYGNPFHYSNVLDIYKQLGLLE